MKRITYSLIVLFLLSAGLSIVSLSCNKEASAQADTPSRNLGILTYFKNINGVITYWKCNYDGTGKTKINIPTLPDNYEVSGIVVSPDGQKVFVSANKTNVIINRIYRIDIDGTNLVLIDSDSNLQHVLQVL